MKFLSRVSMIRSANYLINEVNWITLVTNLVQMKYSVIIQPPTIFLLY
jgi:hypothetical protein